MKMLYAIGTALAMALLVHADETSATRAYRNQLTPIADPRPLLADYPQWVEPIRETRRFEAPILVDDPGADLHVRAWRFSYNARGIIEMPNRLRAIDTAVIVVHPWGIDDGQGWNTPEPAGIADFCTPEKNRQAAGHTRQVINPFIKSLRGKVAFVMYSLRGPQDPIHRKLYRSLTYTPSEQERAEGRHELEAKLRSFTYRGQPLVEEFVVSTSTPVVDYFKKFPGLDAGPKYNNAGFWDLPIPVCSDMDLQPDDIVIHDEQGYPLLRDFLKKHGVRHILLTGYATDMCYAETCAGYKNLSQDFNVFLVGDATLATFPAHETPRFATSAHIAFASINQLITQVSWVQYRPEPQASAAREEQQ